MAVPPDRIVCPICSDSSQFAAPRDLIKHFQIYHCYLNNKLAFECRQCNSIEENFDQWKAHVQSHDMCAMDYEDADDEFLRECFSKVGPENSVESRLQMEAANFLLKIRDECNATDALFISITKGTEILLDMVLDIVQKNINVVCRRKQDRCIIRDEACQTIDTLRGNNIFEGLQSPDKLASFIQSKRCFVRPELVTESSKEVFKMGVPRSIDLEKGYYVPFLKMLENLLNCPEVLYCVDHPEPSIGELFRGPLDGYAYQHNPLVQQFGRTTLAISSYDDDVGLTDSASSQSRKVKFIYWALMNLAPELRSQNSAIQLLSCVESDTIGRLGHKAYMKDFVDGMKQLTSEEGVTFCIAGEERVFHGILFAHLGDNPASARVAGFKESHFAVKGCRQCLVSKEEMFKSFDADDFQLRNKTLHKQQLKEVEDFKKNPLPGIQNPSVTHGINSQSVLMGIKFFDVTKCFPQDLFHDVILGSLKQEICCLLLSVLEKEKKETTVTAIDERITHLSKFFGVNKPPPLSIKNLKDYKVRGSGAETLALARMLPFALAKDLNAETLEFYCAAENLQCYILRLNLLDLEMSSEFTHQDVGRLRNMIKEHHTRFEKLYPGKMTPKFHYEVHIPTQILLFGPLRTHWCFRFEGKHAYFKRICRTAHNFTNICWTLSLRHQEKQCGLMMMSSHTNPFLHASDKLGVPQSVKIKDSLHSNMLSQIFPGVTLNDVVFKHTFIKHKSVHYDKGQAIVISFPEPTGNLPVLGEIIAIYSYSNKVAFVYEQLETEKFEWSLNAFKIRHTEKLGVELLSNLVYHSDVAFIKSVHYNYVLLPCKSNVAAKF